jgi:predicted secreted protein
MKVEKSRVQVSTQTMKLLDKKMRTREYTMNKYVVILKDSTDFEDKEEVKIVKSDDFEKLGRILQELRDDNKMLQKQVNVLEDIKYSNETHIQELKSLLEKSTNTKDVISEKLKILFNTHLLYFL